MDNCTEDVLLGFGVCSGCDVDGNNDFSPFCWFCWPKLENVLLVAVLGVCSASEVEPNSGFAVLD